MFWWSIAGKESGMYSNREEALAAYACLGVLMRLGVPSEDIAVLTMYNEQEQVVRGLAKTHDTHHYFRNVNVSTIDSFQGHERPVIIISLVRSNKDGRVGFLCDPRRLTVALSRARSALIFIGNPETVCHDKQWKRTFKHFQKCSNTSFPFSCPTHNCDRVLTVDGINFLTLEQLFSINSAKCACSAFSSALFNPSSAIT